MDNFLLLPLATWLESISYSFSKKQSVSKQPAGSVADMLIALLKRHGHTFTLKCN